VATLSVNVGAALGLVEKASEAAAQAAAEFLARAVRAAVATPFPPPSAPLTPPHRRSSVLQNSIRAEKTAEGWSVGSNAPYAAWLETGTRRMAPRPFMLPTVLANADGAAEAGRKAAADAARS
jgi:HK97 gp10 family phage protein